MYSEEATNARVMPTAVSLPMKRFTSVELHRRVRAACARRGLRPSSVLRDLLEREFPDKSGQFHLPL
jgi:hypothetical protein